jgi:hypothetical protein
MVSRCVECGHRQQGSYHHCYACGEGVVENVEGMAFARMAVRDGMTLTAKALVLGPAYGLLYAAKGLIAVAKPALVLMVLAAPVVALFVAGASAVAVDTLLAYLAVTFLVFLFFVIGSIPWWDWD